MAKSQSAKKPSPSVDIITTTGGVRDLVARFAGAEFLAIDTEFMREHTYYAQLCLIQISDGTHAAAIDPLANGIDLSPLWSLLADTSIVKVFHAAHQDLEIFLKEMDALPLPLFDSQIAATVLGHGDQVGYDRLVRAILNHEIDKTSRFTDWSRRPLTERQISYALDDVIYLAKIYPILCAELEKRGRAGWLEDENARLAKPETYRTAPSEAWKRIKIRSMKPAALRRMMHLAAWREDEAKRRDLPRNRVLRDETILDLAGSNPSKAEDFGKIRNFPGGAGGKLVASVLKLLTEVENMPDSTLPEAKNEGRTPKPPAAVIELLRVLLKHITDKQGIAPRLIASADELEQLALDDAAPVRAQSGWRYDVFGKAALRLKHGKIAMAVEGRQIKLIDIED
ncbi:ribonuclease D [Alphaproteobacteria bacterium]|jgi:ribonuclease D|nr:ribonuclease D [Alphaproteobacteria bacterium]